MGKYDDIELQGADRAEALTVIGKQIADWVLTMPTVDPICLHFGLNDFYTIGETEFWIANETERGYCGKYLFVFDGQTCPHHFHKMKHETFFVVKGSISMRTDENELIMEQGAVLVMPPGVAHSFTGIGPALILEVSQPSILQDNFFSDKRIGQNGVI
ncbi:MAG: cupin domain-containing protein [Armatimonadota bacterium]